MKSAPAIYRYHAYQFLSKVEEEEKFYREGKWMQLVEVLNKYVIGMKVKDFKSNQFTLTARNLHNSDPLGLKRVSSQPIKLGRLSWEPSSLQKICTYYLEYEQVLVQDIFLMSYSPQKSDQSHLPVFHFYFGNEPNAREGSAYNQSLLLLFREDFYAKLEEIIKDDLAQLHELLPAKVAYHCLSPLSGTVKQNGQVQRFALSYACHAISPASLEMTILPEVNWEAEELI